METIMHIQEVEKHLIPAFLLLEYVMTLQL